MAKSYAYRDALRQDTDDEVNESTWLKWTTGSEEKSQRASVSSAAVPQSSEEMVVDAIGSIFTLKVCEGSGMYVHAIFDT